MANIYSPILDFLTLLHMLKAHRLNPVKKAGKAIEID